MDKIFTILRHFLRQFFVGEHVCPPDPLARMDLVELADLPVTHPRQDECTC